MGYTAYKNTPGPDLCFDPVPGAVSLQGKPDEAARFVERKQLLDPALWTLFVNQFREGNTDDHDKGWRGEYWGKMMRGACFTYAYTQNETLYRVLSDTVEDLLTTEDAFGRISSYSVPREFHGWDVWGRKYVLLGLQYFLEICRDDALAARIVACMCRGVDYMMEKIGNGGVAKFPITHASEWWEGLNASSVLEPIVRLHILTGEEKYLSFAREIIDAGGLCSFNIFEAALEGKKYPYEYPVTKAYEMISNFEGILEYYRVTGEEKYLTMAVNFAHLVIDSDITVIGSAGTTHELFDHSRVRQFDPKFNGIMQETCVTVTWMKFCHRLLCLTMDPLYADQIETSMYNALFGAVNFRGVVNNRGMVFTFDSYSPLLNGIRGRAVGGYKDIIPEKKWWGCCVAIAAAGTAMAPMTAVMQTKDGAAVHLYIPGEVRLTGRHMTLITETDYPRDGHIRIRISGGDNCTLSLRIPAWSREAALSVNGAPIPVTPGTYASVTRAWQDGDTVELTLDMRTEIIPAAAIDPKADPESVCHASLRRGPIALAADSAFGRDITLPVTLKAEHGYAVIREAGPSPMDAYLHVKALCEDGEEIDLIDYASAGLTWEEDKPITVWLTTK